MKSLLRKRSVVLDGHKTSLSLEDAFWIELKEIARSQSLSVSKLVAGIAAREQRNLSSGIRIFVLEHLQNQGKQNIGFLSPTKSDQLDFSGNV